MKKLLLVTAICSLSGTAFANSQGDHVVHAGVLSIMPSTGPSEVMAKTIANTSSPLPGNPKAKVGSVATLGFGYDYFISDFVSIGLQLGIPPKHDVISEKTGKVVGEVTQTTPEIKFKFFLADPSSTLRPYLSAGVANAAFEGKITDPTFKALLGETVEVDSKMTFVGSAGLQYNITDNLALSGSVSYMDLNQEVKFPDAPAAANPAVKYLFADAAINPVIGYLNVSYTF